MNETARKIGARIRAARKARALAQSQLGKLVGLDQAHISRLESGAYEGSPSQLLAIAQALGVSTAVLFGEEGMIFEDRFAKGAAEAARRILADEWAPIGLRDLAADLLLVGALQITEAEWESLASLKAVTALHKDGYVQLLLTLRAVTGSPPKLDS